MLPTLLFLAAAATQGGTLRLASAVDAATLDPAEATDSESLNICDNIYDNLVEFESDAAEVKPGLAERWVVSPDRTEYVFHLRKGIKFHDGSELNADAVVFNLLRQLDPRHEAYVQAAAKNYWAAMDLDKVIQLVKKVDEHAVSVKLQRPDIRFLPSLAMYFMGIVSPTAVKKYGSLYNRYPTGTGPFKLETWARGEQVVLAKNASYWREGLPHLDRVIIRVITDSGRRVKAFAAGDVDMLNLTTPAEAAEAKRLAPKTNLIVEDAMNVAYVAMNPKVKPLDNVLVRRAINHAIDKAAIIAKEYAGYAIPAKNPMPAMVWGHFDKLEAYPFDLAAAKATLAKAGVAPKDSLELLYPPPRPYMPNPKGVAEVIQAQLAKIGIKTHLKQAADMADVLEKMRNGEFGLGILGWTGENRDPDYFLNVLLGPTSRTNFAKYENSAVTDLLLKARLIDEKTERTKLYERAQQLIHDDAPWVPLVHTKVLMPLSPKLNGFVAAANGVRKFETVWLTP